MSERYFFCHIPKTAGTSTMRALTREFGEEAIYPRPEDRAYSGAAFDVDHLRTAFEASGHQIKVVAGHFPLCTTELLGEEFRTFTILRDPVERTLSHLRYHRLIDSAYENKTLEEIYAEPQILFKTIYNQMVKMLGTTPDEVTEGALSWVDFTPAHLERAKKALDRIDVVGLQTEYPAFLAALEDAFGWDLGEAVRDNMTALEPVDAEFSERIRRDSPLDDELYRYALGLVATRRSEHRRLPST